MSKFIDDVAEELCHAKQPVPRAPHGTGIALAFIISLAFWAGLLIGCML